MLKGMETRQGAGQWILTFQCQHQAGRLYVVEGAEANWVCSSQARPSHSLAGFLKELDQLNDPRITALMRRWGLYFRQLPLPAEQEPVQEEVQDNAQAS